MVKITQKIELNKDILSKIEAIKNSCPQFKTEEEIIDSALSDMHQLCIDGEESEKEHKEMWTKDLEKAKQDHDDKSINFYTKLLNGQVISPDEMIIDWSIKSV